MKKSLIALAVAGAFAAPAFAATENVDVYGKLHLSVSMFDDHDDNAFSDLQVSSNASRIGFKGAEDLGGGLSAIWQIESGVNLDEQNGTFASRNSFVGLKGGFGTALIGNHDTPFKLVGRAVDLFGDTMADSRNILGGNNDSSDMRADNVIAYISPSFSGLTVAAAYSTDPLSNGSTTGDAADSDVWSLNATYTNGPIFVGAGYSSGDALETGLNQDNNWRIAGGYTFGNFKVVGQYDSYEAADATLDADFTAWMVGGAYTMGNIVLKANYIAGEEDCNGCAEPTQWTIGGDYNLSKRTSVYALYVSAEEGVILGYGAGSSDRIGGLVQTNGDQDVSALSIGVTHSF